MCKDCGEREGGLLLMVVLLLLSYVDPRVGSSTLDQQY